MAFAFVQAANNGTAGASASSIAATVTALTNGNIILGIVTWGSSSATLSSVTDGTNTYTLKDVVTDSTNGARAQSFYAYNVSGSPTTITANFSASVPYRGISVQEFSGEETGSDPFDQSQAQLQTAPGTGTDGAKSGAGTQTPAAANSLVWGGSCCTSAVGSGVSQFAAGTNFTEPANAEYIAASQIMISSEYEIQTTATARNASFTLTAAGAHATFQMIFKVAGAGGAAYNAVPTLTYYQTLKRGGIFH